MVKPQEVKAIAATATAAAAAAVTAYKILGLFDGPPSLPQDRFVPPIPNIRFNLDDMDEDAAYEYTRFSKTDIRRLAHLFGLESITYPERVSVKPKVALCVLLYRLARPRSYSDLILILGGSRAWLCQVFNAVVDHLARKYRGLMQWDAGRLNQRKLEEYAKAVESAGGPSIIWGFIDGTFRPSNRPGVNQRSFYSGHKKSHGLKYQGIVTPEGLISGLHGPALRKTGDWKLWMDSGITARLRSLFENQPLERRLLLYGDKAYVMGGFGITGAFSATANQPLTPAKERFNRTMTRFRISVEHGFGKITNEWQHLDFTRASSLGLSPVAAIYHVAVLLTNCHTCLYGSQSASFFSIRPPSLEHYLGGNG